DRIAFVPQRDAEAQVLIPVAEAGERLFVPAVGAAPRVVVREVRPRVAVGAVVLADRSPGAVADVGAPALPVRGARGRVEQAPRLHVVLRSSAHTRARSASGRLQRTIFRSSRKVA